MDLQRSTVRDRVIHIEPSSRCAIACHNCPRTEQRGNYLIGDCDIDTVVRACDGYKKVIMCGDHGDPIYHANLHGLISGLRLAYPSICIDIVTNGSHRSQTWWERLTPLLHKGDSVIFSIDGMPDNNHIYRENSSWPSIETAIKILRGNPNVRMVWKWIVFKYNELQIQQGMSLAKDLGFNKFLCIHSIRYAHGRAEFVPTKTLEDITREIQSWQSSHRAVI
jgi:hypothetical protein